MSERPTNVQLIASFRALLTDGFHVVDDMASDRSGTEHRNEVLRVTKPWRAELWNAFNEIEERLCPLEVETRRRIKNENDKA